MSLGLDLASSPVTIAHLGHDQTGPDIPTSDLTASARVAMLPGGRGNKATLRRNAICREYEE